jgi:hypothetical protein
MKQRYNFSTKLLRIVFYVGSIGGLLLLFSTIFWGVWNSFCMEQCGGNSMSYLESIGLVSIAYVVYSAIRFAQIDDHEKISHSSQNITASSTDQYSTTNQNDSERAYNFTSDTSSAQESNTPRFQTTSVSKQTSSLSDLTPSQREALLREVARCCGKPYDCAETKQIDDPAISSSGA